MATGQPSVRSTSRAVSAGDASWPRLAQEAGRLDDVERQVGGPDLDQPPLDAHPPEGQRHRPAAPEDEARLRGHLPHQHREEIEHVAVGQLVDVVEHEDERLAAGEHGDELGQRRGTELRGSGPERRHASGIDGFDAIEGQCDVGQQGGGVVLGGAEGEPGDRARVGGDQLGDEGRLAVTGGRRHRDHVAVAGADAIDERGTGDDARRGLVELGGDRHEANGLQLLTNRTP